MTSISLRPKPGQGPKDAAKAQSARLRKAITSTAYKIAAQVQQRGRIDIAEAGRFGPNWIFGLRAFKQRKEAGTRRTIVTVKHNIPFAEIFEEGGVVRGRPLLWIPFSDAKDAVGVRARRYNLRLFRIKSKKGTPLLITPKGKPKYFGVHSVTEPKLFHIRQIAADEAKRAGEYFHFYLDE
jgi:hypothetical protein